jgi:hypothetical protein
MFSVGQKVVCVKIGRGAYWAAHNKLTDANLGGLYTIRDIFTGMDGRAALRFDEIHNRMHANGQEFGFWAHRFRPIVERKTDISIFTSMLHKKKERA